MEPFVKWAGGKRQLLDELKKRMPDCFDRYIEPFVGGGAWFLDMHYNNVIVNDSNEQLINCYTQIRDNVQAVLVAIEELDSLVCDKDQYLAHRNRFNEKISHNEHDIESAALFIWLNKHCFNGLYRTNRKGLFNTPWNNKEKCDSVDKENLLQIHDYFVDGANNILFNCGDYRRTCELAHAGDFLFIDPPYDPVGEYGDFKRYTKEQFGTENQQELAMTVQELVKRGCYVMVTNSNTPLINDLYRDYRIDVIRTRRNINSKGNRRTGEDVIITTF